MRNSPECVELDEGHVPHTALHSSPALNSLRLQESARADGGFGVGNPIETVEDPASRAVTELPLNVAWEQFYLRNSHISL